MRPATAAPAVPESGAPGGIDLRSEPLPEGIGQFPPRQDWLRPYQARAVLGSEHARSIVVIPTGGGKSRVAAIVARAATGMGSAIPLSHREELELNRPGFPGE